jgi:hypothetical protein
MDLLKDPQIVEMLGLLHKSILVYYRFYSGPKGLISFEKFQRFYKDFEIFPDLLPKSKVVSIFQTLSKLYQQNHANCLEIDQHMFVESLALSAMEVQTHDQATNLERVPHNSYLDLLPHRTHESIKRPTNSATACRPHLVRPVFNRLAARTTRHGIC